MWSNSFKHSRTVIVPRVFIEKVSIKPGSVYKGDYLKSFANQLFYPGEILLNTIEITYIKDNLGQNDIWIFFSI